MKRAIQSMLILTLLACTCPRALCDASDFAVVDLSGLFNADIFSSYQTRTDGQVDAGRASFPAEMMPPSGKRFKTAGVEFVFPEKEDGALNAIRCEGQEVSVPSVDADYLYFLATAADGNHRTTIQLSHEGDESFETSFDVNDWCAENPGLGGVHGVVSEYRHTLGGKQTCKTSIWLIPVRLRSDRPLKTVRLPDNQNVFVVGISLGPGGEERRIQTYIKDAYFPSKETDIDRLVLLEIVEPESNSTLRLLSDDDWKHEYREMATFDLKPGIQSIPVWLPIMKRRTYYFDIGDKHLTSLDETNLFENAPATLIELEATRPVHPADADLGMAPAWQVPALPDTDLRIKAYIPDGPTDRINIRAVVTPEKGSGTCKTFDEPAETRTSSPASITKTFDLGELTPGEYRVSIDILVNDMPYGSRSFLLTLVDSARVERPFGARETDLQYNGPVWTNWDEAITYEEAWEGFTNKDIVIDFPNTPYRYVFWKGASYAPIWLFDKSFITLEWLEGWPRQEGAVDCVEPLQDKACKHSRVKLLSSTPARARVKWTYAETDFNLKIIAGEHAEEIYSIYPDGIGVRKVTGFFEKGRWHECAEFIVGSVAGTTPAAHYPPNAASLMNVDGDRIDLFWPTPQESEFPEWNSYIGLAHSRNEPSVFLACDGRNTDIHVFSNNPDWLSEMFFCMPHWPIQRGLPTTNERSIDDCKVRPTHASLLNIYASPYELYKDRTVWALLIGIVPDDEQELRDIVRGWLNPPALEVLTEPGVKAKYDIYERGYVMDAGKKDSLDLRLQASVEKPQIRPALILENAGSVAACSVFFGDTELVPGTDYAAGQEEGRYIIWLNKALREVTNMRIVLTPEDTSTGEEVSP